MLECVHKGITIAVKFVDIDKGDVAALETEKNAYKRLSELQGVCIPHIYSYKVESLAGMMTGFAMTKLDPLPSDVKQWTHEMKVGARAALCQLAKEGKMKHNDIRAQNFGLLHNKVMVLDLENMTDGDGVDANYELELDSFFS